VNSVIVVIMCRNCAFCWNSNTFCRHTFCSVNIKRLYTEVDKSRPTKVCRKIRNGSHVLYQYTMCYMKCKAGELRACSIILKTQYNNIYFENHGNQSEFLYAKVLLSIVRKCSIYNASYTFDPCWKTGRYYSLKVQRNMCIWIYKNIINKYFILYKYCIVCYTICYTIFYYFI
jgi:hypothetical protein